MTDNQIDALIAIATGRADDATLADFIGPDGPQMTDGLRHVLANAVAGRSKASRRLVEERRANRKVQERLNIGRWMQSVMADKELLRVEAVGAAAERFGISEGRADAAFDLARKADGWVEGQREFGRRHGLKWSDEQLDAMFRHSVRVGDQIKREDASRRASSS